MKKEIRKQIRKVLRDNNIKRTRKMDDDLYGHITCYDAVFNGCGYYTIKIYISRKGIEPINNLEAIENVRLYAKQLKEELGDKYEFEEKQSVRTFISDDFQNIEFSITINEPTKAILWEEWSKRNEQEEYEKAMSQKERNIILGGAIYNIFKHDPILSELVTHIYQKNCGYHLECSEKSTQKLLAILNTEEYFEKNFCVKKVTNEEIIIVLKTNLDKYNQLHSNLNKKQIISQYNKIQKLKNRKTRHEELILKLNKELDEIKQQIIIEEKIYEDMSNV